MYIAYMGEGCGWGGGGRVAGGGRVVCFEGGGEMVIGHQFCFDRT